MSFTKGGVCLLALKSVACISIFYRCDNQRATICHPHTRCGRKLFNRIWLKGCLHVFFSLNQQVSGFKINPSLHTHKFTSTYLSYTLKSLYYYKDKITYINFTIPWVKVSLYKFITALHSFYSIEYLTSLAHFRYL